MNVEAVERGAGVREGEPGARKLGVVVLVAVCCAIAAFNAVRVALEAYELHRPYVVDDAYITLRYAKNLADGLGVVWNPGERVEGYTSFFAVVAIAALHVLGVSLESAARNVNLFGVALLVVTVFAHGLRLERGIARWPLALGPALLVTTYVPLWIWVNGRLEAPLYAGVVALALHATTRLLKAPENKKGQLAAGLSLGLLPLVRPDGAVFGVVAALVGLVAFARIPERRVLSYVRFGAIAIALPLAHLAFRRLYYGEWVPNTVFAKSTGIPEELLVTSGRDYVHRFLDARPPIAAIAAVLAPLAFVDRGRRLQAAFLALSAIGYVVLIERAGGDHMIAHRLLLPAISPMALLLAESLHGFASLRTTPYGERRTALIAGAATLLLVPLGADAYPSAQRPDLAAYVGSMVGEHLRDRYPPGTLVALHTAGSTPYFAPELRYIDMLGLNDAHIARRQLDGIRIGAQTWPGHAKGDGAYVLSRAPDVIILGPAEGTTVDRPWFLSDLELGASPDFRERYILREQLVDVSNRPFHGDVPATSSGTLRITLYERIEGGGVRAPR